MEEGVQDGGSEGRLKCDCGDVKGAPWCGVMNECEESIVFQQGGGIVCGGSKFSSSLIIPFHRDRMCTFEPRHTRCFGNYEKRSG